MNKTSKWTFLAALVATSVGSPVLAAHWRDGRIAQATNDHDGLAAYGMVRGAGLNAYENSSPRLNGGGSSGYNAGEKVH